MDGQPLAKAERQLKASLGYLPQDFGLFDELTVTQFLDYMAALKGLRSPKAAIREVIRAVNLEEKARARIRTLSGGQRQRVGIAQALLGDPPFLIFDEPTVGLDPEERIHFRNLFSRTAQDRLVLLSTHIIEDVQSVCDQIVVIDHGQILLHRHAGAADPVRRRAMWASSGSGRPAQEQGLHITARVNTSQGVRCRAVADTLPAYAQAEEPSLEDAYLYLISQGGGTMKTLRLFPLELGRLLQSRLTWLVMAADGPLPGGGAGALQARHGHHHALHVSGQPRHGRRRGGRHPVRPADHL